MQSAYYTTKEYRDKMHADLHVTLKDTIILMCAIFIASIGLNMNSTAVIIGAMLISPLMTPIVGLGFGLSMFDFRMVRQSLTLLASQVSVSLFVSTAYFWLSPISAASSEIVARTSPTIWDVLIAIAGGIAGVIGSRKRDANNIVPGVAIATALMPPICTAGYGLATQNMTYFFGAFYLFLINFVFIMLTNFVGSVLLTGRDILATFSRLDKKIRLTVVAALILLVGPAFYSASSMVANYARNDAIAAFVKKEFEGQTVISQSYDAAQNKLNVTTVGERLSPQELDAIEEAQGQYGLKGMELQVNQVVAGQNVNTEDIQQIYESIDQYLEDKLNESNNKKEGLSN